jgi:integrase
MGRKRIRDFDLPPRLHRRGARFYYVTHERRWIPLGANLAVAKRKWADLECLGIGNTVRELVWSYFDAKVAGGKHSTVTQYRSFANKIEAEWGTLPADRLTRVQIARWRDSPGVSKGCANGVISLLRVAYRWAMERNEEIGNPAVDVAFNDMPVRERYLTDDEFRAFWNAAPRWVRTAMDLSYLTALRPSDVLALRWEDVGERLSSRTRKTGVRLAFTVTPEVQTVLDEARQRPILGLYVIANDKGRQLNLRRWQAVMRAACAELGIEDATPRDIRAKAATDAEAEGLDYQALLGHATKAMSDRYLKLKRTRLAPTLSRNIR